MQTELACAKPTKKYPNGCTGTQAGYLRHYRAGEPACEECLAGRAAYSRAYYTPTGNPPGRPWVSEEHRRETARRSARRWREANPELARAAWQRGEAKRDPEKRRANARNTQRRKRAIMDELKSSPCADCGVSYPPYVMHFDHRDPATKLFNVGTMTMRKLPVILAEIEKCDLVCANCHAERTWGPGRKVAASEQNLGAG